MKTWINFTKIKNDQFNIKKNKFEKCEPYHQIGIGSFANISMDGRFSLNNHINFAYEYMKKNNFDGFIIYKGEWLKENNAVYKNLTL